MQDKDIDLMMATVYKARQAKDDANKRALQEFDRARKLGGGRFWLENAACALAKAVTEAEDAYDVAKADALGLALREEN